MTAKKHHWILTLFLIIVLCASLLNVSSARADGETPTEPPAPTEVQTDPTEPPAESTPEAVEATPVVEALTQIPEATEVVVLDESGDSVPLATEQAAEIVAVIDPIWCPEGVLPGGAGCSASYTTISDLINNMVSNTAFYTQNGVIYFTADPGAGTFNLSPTTLTSDYDTLKNYNLTLQGGWNGSTLSPALSGQTDFGNRPITIGDGGNPWVGNISLKDIMFCGDLVGTCSFISQTALTIQTSGNITLNNVDVYDQGGGNNTALLSSTAGNITVTNGTFDGNNSNSSGFSASANNGSITISNTVFQENKKSGPSSNATGATLQAPVITLNNVTSTNNDANGITINGANTVRLVNVAANGNGTDVTPAGFTGNFGSGLFMSGNPGSNVFITGGSFNNNQRYGIEIEAPANVSVYMSPSTQCTGNDSNAAFGTCSNDTLVVDSSAPAITPSLSGTAGLNGWYVSDVSVGWSANDAESGIFSSTGCTPSNLTSDTAGTTLTCSATNNIGLSSSASLTIKIDKTTPVLSLPSDISTSASGPISVNYFASASDNLDPSVLANCAPVSGSTFSLGTTTVNCFSTDEAGNGALGSFLVTVADSTVIVTPPAPTPTSTGSTPGTTTSGSSTSDSSGSQSNSSQLIIPLTGGEVINLSCNSTFWAFGIKLSFMNLCDYQTTLHRIDAGNLPGQLPDGSTFAMGLDLSILSQNQAIEALPNGTSVQMDFPISGGKDQFAVLHWDGSAWVEVAPQANDSQSSYQIVTTDKIGSFVLVKK